MGTLGGKSRLAHHANSQSDTFSSWLSATGSIAASSM
jgi:hypothetical protein